MNRVERQKVATTKTAERIKPRDKRNFLREVMLLRARTGREKNADGRTKQKRPVEKEDGIEDEGNR